MDYYIGKTLDNRYEILERIGTGGMAVVYKAKCHRLNRLVALKILKSELAQDDDFRRRFNAESQAIAQLSHPNIVSVYDVSRGGDTDYIVMELIDGISLKQYMEKRGRLNWRESLHFITEIMKGLNHAHSRGVIHRDIKPQNIMVLRDGSVRVTDFGIACLENSAQTLTQEAFGSVHYISPEQARGDRITPRSDIYSAGVVLYEMLTGRLPFEGDSAVSVAIQHLSSIPLAPREIDAEIPKQMELICMKAMMPEFDKRYPSSEAMIADLEAFRKNPGVSLAFDLSDLRPNESDEPTMPLQTTSVRVAASGGGGTYTPPKEEMPQKKRRHDYEDDEPSGGSKTRAVLVVIAVLLAGVLAFTLFSSILESFENPVIEQYVVKSVVGKTLEEAQATEGVKDIFQIQVMEEQLFSDTYPAGTIAKQDPTAGENRKGENLIIKVWISAGEATEEMLDVTGLTVAQAKSRLKTLIQTYDLEIVAPEEDYQFNDFVNEGCIISSVPAEGEVLKKGDTIHLVVSKGKDIQEIMVPNFVGMDYEQALSQIDSTGLTWLGAETQDSDRPAGQIIWQSLEAWTTALEGDGISFIVSSGTAATTQKTIPIELPQDDRAVVLLEVYVGGETDMPQYSAPLSCSDEYAEVTLEGSGYQYIKICFDGVLDQSQSRYLDFDADANEAAGLEDE